MLIRTAALAWVLLLFIHGSALAQAPAAADAPPIRIGSAVLSGFIHFDYRAESGDAADAKNEFFVRRARVQLAGPVTKEIAYTVSAEATTDRVLRDAYITLTYLPGATVRVGQLVMPFSLERSEFSANAMAFTERVLLALVPGRDAGIQVSNDRPFFGWLSYGAAIVNGTGQNAADDNRAKDVMLRVAAAPPRAGGLSLGASAARGEQPGGLRTRTGADINFERRAFQVAMEFVRETTEDGRHTKDGFYALGGWKFYPPAPRRAFDHAEVFARYTRITGAPGASPEWDLAANYYVNRAVRLMCDLIVPDDRDRRGTTVHARMNVRF